MEEFRRQTRGGIGVKAYKLTRVRGTLVGARAVTPDDEVYLISSAGIANKQAVGKISRQKRDSTGVKVINMADDQSLSAFAVVHDIEE